jgi:hypothetical protein
MIRLLSDHDVEQQARLIWEVFDPNAWRNFGAANLVSLSDFGLDKTASDRLIWTTCQSQNLLLVTANRNANGVDALENVIAEWNNSTCLPVLTIGNPRQVMDFRYREDCAYRIADILLQLEQIRGTGRMFLP